MLQISHAVIQIQTKIISMSDFNHNVILSSKYITVAKITRKLN